MQDAHYYWTHRVLHDRRVFAWAHAAHHRARDPSPFASFAFDPAEAVLTAWLLPVLAFVVPLNIWMLAVMLTAHRRSVPPTSRSATPSKAPN